MDRPHGWSADPAQAPARLQRRGKHHKGGDDGDGGGDGGGGDGGNPPWMVAVGTTLGWVSSVLYLASRLSQIYKNYTRQSAEGLAFAMFVMAACANLCTGTGILLRTFTLQELADQGPWLAGSLGTITLDMIILSQSLKYGTKQPHESQAQQQQQQQQPHEHAHHGVHVHPHHHISHPHHHHHHRSGAARAGARHGDESGDDERAPLLPT
jgi:uncharacterized protein with PQ loop repeat